MDFGSTDVGLLSGKVFALGFGVEDGDMDSCGHTRIGEVAGIFE